MEKYEKQSYERFRKYRELADMEYRHRLLGKVSKCVLHDISTPLSVLSGSLNMMENNFSKEGEREINRMAYESLQYIEEVLENSLDIVRKGESKEEFNPNEVIERIVGMLSWRINKSNIVIRKEIEGDVLFYGNKSSFSRIVLNLLLNSVEELEAIKKKDKRINIKTWVESNMFCFSIKDTGNGIKKEIVKDLCKGIFYSNDCNHLGIGLFFVFNSVKCEFDGVINIDSEINKYTNIEINIPL
jgi:two-component system phosphate regulon sensor histidine kinase PhoR